MQSTVKLILAIVAVFVLSYFLNGGNENAAKQELAEEGDDQELVNPATQPRKLEQTKQQDQVHNKPIANTAISAADESCTPEESLMTMSTRWATNSDSLPGKTLRVKNESGKTLFLKLSDAPTSKLLETIVLLAGESINEPIFSELTHVEIQTGKRWCNRLKGWSDRDTTIMSRPIVTVGKNGAFELKIGLNAETNDLSLTVVEPTQIAHYTQNKETTLHLKPAPQRNVTPRQTQQPSKTLTFQPSANSLNQRELPQIQTRQPSLGTQSAEPTQYQPQRAVTTQDWRDVPPRDLRLVSNGNRHYLGGRVGEEDVQFEIARYGYSAISEDLAMKSGAFGCNKGIWTVNQRVWNTCMKVIPHVQFGSVELDNVMMVVIPANVRPVLGTDLIRSGKIHKGIDGNYLEVGRH